MPANSPESPINGTEGGSLTAEEIKIQDRYFEDHAVSLDSVSDGNKVVSPAWVSLRMLSNDGKRWRYVNVRNWPIRLVKELFARIQAGFTQNQDLIEFVDYIHQQLGPEASCIPVDVLPNLALPRIIIE